ncbi:hypothetical protein [Leucothrix pacifica]|uniref:hypothetical protein n=1 Tax=Leucothrix pacifica TaxID=1247513 RepID=UPI0011B29A28|nr:hypothetical protein [Leucothrix pacifica]
MTLNILPSTHWRSTLGGWLILLFAIIALTLITHHQALSYTGLMAAVAVILLPTTLSKTLLWQCGLMLGIGFSLLIWMHFLGDDVPWLDALNSNIPLLILFTSVSFLRVLPVTPAAQKQRTGPAAFVQTLLGTHLLAAIINMSASIVVADYLNKDSSLSKTLAILTMRAVCIAAYWSPFFGAMATVLHYLPDIDILSLWIYSIPLTLIALTISFFEAKHTDPEHLTTFKGYPIGIGPLLLPLSLLISALVARLIWPDVAMVLLVSISALLIPCLFLIKRQGVIQSTRSITRHVSVGLGNLRGEFLLFISAGVLGYGGTALLKHYPPLLPFETFDAGVASLLLLLLLAVAMLGAHVLVGISVTAPVILSTDPDTTLLALCYLSAWSIAAVMSPFSGLSLFFKGHYQLSLAKMFSYHWRFGLIMTLAAMIAFYMV